MPGQSDNFGLPGHSVTNKLRHVAGSKQRRNLLNTAIAV